MIARVLEIDVQCRKGEGHVGWFGGNTESVEQRGEVRVVGFVIDDESGVDGDAAVARGDVDGSGVPTDVIVGLQQRDAMVPRKEPSGTEAGHPATHNRDCFRH